MHTLAALENTRRDFFVIRQAGAIDSLLHPDLRHYTESWCLASLTSLIFPPDPPTRGLMLLLPSFALPKRPRLLSLALALALDLALALALAKCRSMATGPLAMST